MAYRSRKEYKVYIRHTKKVQSTGACEFCKIKEGNAQFVASTKSFLVIKNIFPYSYFDYRRVSDHLMVIPIKHTDTLSSLTPEEATEYVKLISSYESKGYDVFARAPSSKQKSVPHQHTHLIKHIGKELHTVIYTKKPFIRIAR